MDTAKYTVLEILEFKNLEQFIIPEIQRDYVWKTPDVLDLLNSLKEGFEGSKKDIPYLGFIYAYNDRDYVYKYFLVDGQQRMTTIFLLLLACHQKVGKKIPEYLFKQGKLKLDYKVRQATHDFLTDFLTHCENNPNDFHFVIKDQIWFHAEFEKDKTISNMTGNYDAIREWLGDFTIGQVADFKKFLEDKVELSYFDIEDGRQGEELYIYMNSRGRQLEPNETLKAKYLGLVSDQSEKEIWGREWEIWQDFFWKHKGVDVDADAGFNDFLQMVQIINMCLLGQPIDEINKVTRGKSEAVLDFNLLPKSLQEIKKYFQSFEWLVLSERVSGFFEKYEKNEIFFSSSSTIDLRKKQIYYLRTLPILAFLSKSKLTDEEIIIRFIRFFYNISRKDSSVGKDISNQLPVAIKVMLEYGSSKKTSFDVLDLINYHKGRTVLINEEEVLKLNLFETPPKSSTRKEMEILFWEAEDHFVFDGEISFLLNKYFDVDTKKFDIMNYKKTWKVFASLFTNTDENNALISKALLYYGSTWVKSTPNYYLNYNCQDWNTLVRRKTNKHLLELLEDLHGKPVDYLDTIIKNKAKEYFTLNNLTSIDSIKTKDELFEQVRVLVAIDYYSENLIWKGSSYIANDERFKSTTYSDVPFFNTDRVIHNVSRYINDGWQGRILPLMKNTLQNQDRLNEVLNEILSA